jgi:hypothetical protein
MPYDKTDWVDEVLSGPERFNIKDNAGTEIYGNVQIELNTPVTTQGTSVDADHLNNLEDGIEAANTGAARSVKGVTGEAGTVVDIEAANDGEVLVRNGDTLEFGKVKNAGLVDPYEPIHLIIFYGDEDVESGEGKLFFTVDPYLDGAEIVDYDIAVITPSTNGLPTVNTYNITDSVNILSTPASVDVGERTSMTAATQPVIANPVLSSGDLLRFDVTLAGTGAKGLEVMLKVAKP